MRLEVGGGGWGGVGRQTVEGRIGITAATAATTATAAATAAAIAAAIAAATAAATTT